MKSQEILFLIITVFIIKIVTSEAVKLSFHNLPSIQSAEENKLISQNVPFKRYPAATVASAIIAGKGDSDFDEYDDSDYEEKDINELSQPKLLSSSYTIYNLTDLFYQKHAEKTTTSTTTTTTTTKRTTSTTTTTPPPLQLGDLQSYDYFPSARPHQAYLPFNQITPFTPTYNEITAFHQIEQQRQQLLQQQQILQEIRRIQAFIGYPDTNSPDKNIDNNNQNPESYFNINRLNIMQAQPPKFASPRPIIPQISNPLLQQQLTHLQHNVRPLQPVQPIYVIRTPFAHSLQQPYRPNPVQPTYPHLYTYMGYSKK